MKEWQYAHFRPDFAEVYLHSGPGDMVAKQAAENSGGYIAAKIDRQKAEALRLRLRRIFLFLSPVSVIPGLDPLVSGGLGVRRDDPLLPDLLRRNAALLDELADVARVFPVEGAPFGDGKKVTCGHIESPP